MSASKTIKKIMLYKDVTVKALAEKLGVSSQVLSNKLYRDTFTYKEYIKIADLLGCDVFTVSRDKSNEYKNN